MEDDYRHDIAMFRYSLVREAADPGAFASRPGRAGAAPRCPGARAPERPAGAGGRATLDSWIRAWRRGGYQALVPELRCGVPLTPEHRLDAAVCAAVLATQGWRPSKVA